MIVTTGTGRSIAGPDGRLDGILHGYVAFDTGEAIQLPLAKQLIAGDFFQLPRETRTPTSFRYRPLPLRCRLDLLSLQLPILGNVSVTPDVTLFDFGGASLAFHVPFHLSAAELAELADGLADPAGIVQAVHDSLKPLIERIVPAIEHPDWSDLIEEYFVFQLHPGETLPSIDSLTSSHASWLAQLVRLDDSIPAPAEVDEALRLRMSYSPTDIVVPDWGAAVVIDRECDEILETIAFANIQLLELRHIDARLDARLEEAYSLTRTLSKRRLPFWRSHMRTVRALGELRVEINESMERTTNALKLIGDQYLARVYQKLVQRFHLEEWARSVDHSLDVLEGIYRIVTDQTATLRAEVLELIIVFLIVIEVVMGLLR